eukprot:SAG11_NODE_8392_length_1021_cov_1.323210_1_plen_153_part_00
MSSTLEFHEWSVAPLPMVGPTSVEAMLTRIEESPQFCARYNRPLLLRQGEERLAAELPLWAVSDCGGEVLAAVLHSGGKNLMMYLPRDGAEAETLAAAATDVLAAGIVRAGGLQQSKSDGAAAAVNGLEPSVILFAEEFARLSGCKVVQVRP